jgi:3-oxoacyl-[acyl-carrier-protein] synthase II
MARVLVTGLGVVSCLGSTVDDYWAGLVGEWRGPVPVPDPHADFAVRHMYRVPHDGEGTSRAVRFAVDAAGQALRDAGLHTDPAARADLGLTIGTAAGAVDLAEDRRAGLDRASASPYPITTAVASRYGLYGPNLSISTACSASLHAIGLTLDAIRDGAMPAAVVGGAECYSRVALACFNRLGALDPVGCRPFDVARAGTVFGEGAAFLLLESEAHARTRRHNRAYAVVEGFGCGCDGYHPTAPEPSGDHIVHAIRAALGDAGVPPDAVDGIIPHGTGTVLNDLVEATALHRVFGPVTGSIAAFNLKAAIGHTGGAAGAFSCLTGALLLDRRLVPANRQPVTPDPACGLALHTGSALDTPLRHILINAYAFGGNNASLLLGRA